MKEKFHINEMINDTSIKIVELDNEILTISLDLADFYNYNAMKYSKESQQNKIDVGDIAKLLHPYAIYKTLENAGKNTYSNTKIIEKIETPDFIEYHFNYGLILNVFVSDTNKNISKSIKEKMPKMAFINPIYFSYDIIGDSNSIPDDELSKLTQYYGYEKKPYRSIFKKEVYIKYSCLERVNFSNCEFESKLALYRLKGSNEAIEFHNGINFENCIFGGEVEFGYFVSGSPLPENKYYNNARETNFKNCIFKKRVDFSNSKICNNIYFTDSIFQDSVDFSQCEFEKTANFYGVKFDKIPNFSQVQFRGSLNVVNTNLDFYFKSLKNKIKQEHIEYNKRESIKKPLAHFANDFRDSFRIFKSTLIKDNNLLDASNFHKYELYSKEIELDSKETKTLRDKVDKLQLWFYRKLCDHHTDILKSFHSLMLVIGLFGLMSLGVIVGFDYCLGYKPILSHLYMIKEIYDAHIQSFIKTHTLYTFAFNIFILAFYLVILVCLISVKYLREVFIGVSYFIVISILLISPKILIPAMGIFTDKRVLLDPLSTLGGIYTIVFGFVLFSFIKTIRKNSIVPN
ncbi:pentapeptide repeat-containing protein [Helicobacter pullorum]|uniref:pentapeptide repeat-containing protein n=1 Tax=Helicobacter pullorum TaxID=35818 RepID=UPI000A560B31|nr:pentapeptide repeat-containing protein [Helicobacter pullorum]